MGILRKTRLNQAAAGGSAPPETPASRLPASLPPQHRDDSPDLPDVVRSEAFRLAVLPPF